MFTEIVWTIIRNNDRILLAQTFFDKWTFPGGEKDKNDKNLVQTAKRKLAEHINVIGERFKHLHTAHRHDLRIEIFCCDKWRNNPIPNCEDIIGVGWFNWTQISTMEFSLSPIIRENLLIIPYLLQHYDHHPDEWREYNENIQ